MLQKKYRSKIVSIVNPFEGIYTLEFESLNGSYKYKPGQFLHLAIDSDYDGIGQWPESRCFSMQSNPDEETIKITYSVKGKFTKLMEETLKISSIIWLKLPYGDLFTKPHNKINTVFIAGGTGITPFLSLFTHSSFNNYSNPKVYLGFKSHSHNIYDTEKWVSTTTHIEVFYEDSTGLINIESIFSINGKSSDYFISGPPLMIKSIKTFLLNMGLKPGQVFTDEWE